MAREGAAAARGAAGNGGRDFPDASPPRRGGAQRHDSPDASPPRRGGAQRHHSSDASPPRRRGAQRHDSPDASPPRRVAERSAVAGPSDGGPKPPAKMLDGTAAGLVSARELAAEAARMKEENERRR